MWPLTSSLHGKLSGGSLTHLPEQYRQGTTALCLSFLWLSPTTPVQVESHFRHYEVTGEIWLRNESMYREKWDQHFGRLNIQTSLIVAFVLKTLLYLDWAFLVSKNEKHRLLRLHKKTSSKSEAFLFTSTFRWTVWNTCQEKTDDTFYLRKITALWIGQKLPAKGEVNSIFFEERLHIIIAPYAVALMPTYNFVVVPMFALAAVIGREKLSKNLLSLWRVIIEKWIFHWSGACLLRSTFSGNGSCKNSRLLL